MNASDFGTLFLRAVNPAKLGNEYTTLQLFGYTVYFNPKSELFAPAQTYSVVGIFDLYVGYSEEEAPYFLLKIGNDELVREFFTLMKIKYSS